MAPLDRAAMLWRDIIPYRVAEGDDWSVRQHSPENFGIAGFIGA
jgi:hypothetical protein